MSKKSNRHESSIDSGRQPEKCQVVVGLAGLRGAAPDGEGAIAIAERAHPDLVLLDINLPGINGYSFRKTTVRLSRGGLVWDRRKQNLV